MVAKKVVRLITALTLALLARAAEARDYGRPRSFIASPGAGHEEPMSVSPSLGISADYGLELGAKLDYLLVDPGFVPGINDTVYLEGALFFADASLFIAPELRWDFNLHPQWTVYGEGGLELGLGKDVRLVVCAGAIWHMPGHAWSLRGEVDAAHDTARVGAMIPI